MIFILQSIYGIDFWYWIILLCIMLHKMVIPKSFNFYYQNQKLKSIVKTFEYKNDSVDLYLLMLIRFKVYLLITFPFYIFHGIHFRYLIKLHWFVLVKMVIPRLSSFYYHDQVLKSSPNVFNLKSVHKILN